MTDTIKIEKGIPLPARIPGVGREPKYPFGRMEIGDSFAIPFEGFVDKSGADRAKNRLAAAASHFGRRNGLKFTCRVVGDNENLRCWRVA